MPRPVTWSTSGSQALRPDRGVDRPVAEPGGVVAAAEEPAVVEDEPLDPDGCGRVGELGDPVEGVVEVDRLPRVGDHGPLGPGPRRDGAQVGVEAVAHRVESGARPRAEHVRGVVGLAGGEDDLARVEQLTPADQALTLGRALGVVGVVAAPRGVHGPHLSGAEGEPGCPGHHDEGRVVARAAVAGVAPVRALHPRVALRRAFLAPASGQVEQLGGVGADGQRGQDRGEVEVAVGGVGHRRPRVQEPGGVERQRDPHGPARLVVGRRAGDARLAVRADVPRDQARRHRPGRCRRRGGRTGPGVPE